MKTKGKVLVLVSSGHGLPLQDGKVYAGAGYYARDLCRIDLCPRTSAFLLAKFVTSNNCSC
jgi:hypothetical protein